MTDIAINARPTQFGKADPAFLFFWLKSNPKTTLECPSCHGKLGLWKAKVGLTLTTTYDYEEDETKIDAKPFAMIGEHTCGLDTAEISYLMELATTWAESHFQRAEREWKKQKMQLEAPDVLDA